MVAYIGRRLAFSIFVLWGAVTIVFAVLRIVPGNPALVILGPDANQAEIDALQESLGLNDPLIVQYFTYLWDVIHLDFGASLRMGGDAMAHVIDRMPMTALLATVAVIIAVAVGVGLGILAALNANSFLDRAITVLSLAGQSIPNFWIGLVFILIFARALGWLPSAGAGSVSAVILPAITLGLSFTALVTRLTRSGLLEVMNEGYVQTARAKGLKERLVVFPHAIRNALIPIVTVIGLYFGTILGGSVIVETVFAWPGVGRLIIDSIGFRDYGVVQAGILMIAAIYVFINLLVDVLYGYVDPRVRLAR